MGDWDYGTMVGDDGNKYYWYVDSGKRLTIYREEELGEDSLVFEQSYPGTSDMDIYHKAIDWVYANAGVYKPPPTVPGGTNPGGIENGGNANILNVAGYWTLGVAQGTLFMLVPMVMVGLSVGFMQRVIKLGAKVGGE